MSLLVTGGTGSGKTTLLNALLGSVAPTERIVTVEDSAELRPSHPHVVALEVRAANVEGAGAVTLRDLVREGLRMRPDRLIVGECRGAEVIDLLMALNTGHDGGAGTVHANTPADLPARLEALALLGGLGGAALHAQLAAAVQAVVHLRRLGAVRAVEEICLLRSDQGGIVRAVTAWSAARGPGAAAGDLAAVLAARGVAPPAILRPGRRDGHVSAVGMPGGAR